MADDPLELYLRQLIQAHAGSPEVVVAWQGGEPTMMGLDFFRRSVQLAEALKQPGQRIVHTIQTNGTLLDDAWAAFFAGHGFLVGLSIDGPLEVCVRAAQAGNGKSATAPQASTAPPKLGIREGNKGSIQCLSARLFRRLRYQRTSVPEGKPLTQPTSS